MHGSYVRGTTDPATPWADKIVTTCMGYLTTGGLIRNRATKLPPTGRIWERSK